MKAYLDYPSIKRIGATNTMEHNGLVCVNSTYRSPLTSFGAESAKCRLLNQEGQFHRYRTILHIDSQVFAKS